MHALSSDRPPDLRNEADPTREGNYITALQIWIINA